MVSITTALSSQCLSAQHVTKGTCNKAAMVVMMLDADSGPPTYQALNHHSMLSSQPTTMLAPFQSTGAHQRLHMGYC